MSFARPAPLIFLDVDGPLIPLRRRSEGWPAPPDDTGNPLLGRLDRADGARLRALGGRLVRATTWMAEANEIIAPRLGLPDLPVVPRPDDPAPDDALPAAGQPLRNAAWPGDLREGLGTEPGRPVTAPTDAAERAPHQAVPVASVSADREMPASTRAPHRPGNAGRRDARPGTLLDHAGIDS